MERKEDLLPVDGNSETRQRTTLSGGESTLGQVNDRISSFCVRMDLGPVSVYNIYLIRTDIIEQSYRKGFYNLYGVVFLQVQFL